jgi:hypothetical protein
LRALRLHPMSRKPSRSASASAMAQAWRWIDSSMSLLTTRYRRCSLTSAEPRSNCPRRPTASAMTAEARLPRNDSKRCRGRCCAFGAPAAADLSKRRESQASLTTPELRVRLVRAMEPCRGGKPHAASSHMASEHVSASEPVRLGEPISTVSRLLSDFSSRLSHSARLPPRRDGRESNALVVGGQPPVRPRTSDFAIRCSSLEQS